MRSASNPNSHPSQSTSEPTSASGSLTSCMRMLQRSPLPLKSSAFKPHSLACVHVLGGSTSSLALKARNRNISIQTAGSQMSSSDLCASMPRRLSAHTHAHTPPPTHTHNTPLVTQPPIHLSLHAFVAPCIYSSVHPSIHLPTNPPNYPST